MSFFVGAKIATDAKIVTDAKIAKKSSNFSIPPPPPTPVHHTAVRVDLYFLKKTIEVPRYSRPTKINKFSTTSEIL